MSRNWSDHWKRSLWSTVGVMALFLFVLWQWWPDDNLHVIACDVGQGDAILLTQGFNQVLIDGGRNDVAVMECLGRHVPPWDRRLEMVVVTHADADHIGGLDAVLERYSTTVILLPPRTKDTTTFNDLLAAILDSQSRGTVVKLPILGQQMRFPLENKPSHYDEVDQILSSITNWWSTNVASGKKAMNTDEYAARSSPTLTFTTLSPQVPITPLTVEKSAITETMLSDIEGQVLGVSSQAEDHNAWSIVLLAEYGQHKVLLTGDLESEGELSLIERNLTTSLTVLKVGHHGAKTSTTPELLQVTQPEVALISVGENNRYGHPSLEVMNRLIENDIQILRTDELGDVEWVSDGENYWLKTGR